MDIIEVEGAQPVRAKPYRAAPHERETLRQIIGEWKRLGIVRETKSPYASPVFLVGKTKTLARVVADYRRLNEQTKKQSFPIPNIDEGLTYLAGCRLFTTLDLTQGYLQVPLGESAKAKTAFITPDETGEFQRMMFGRTNAPYEFCRLMSLVLKDLKRGTAVGYMDDIIIPAVDWPDMLKRLRAVFEALRRAKLTLNPRKCQFGMTRVEYLGHVVVDGNLKPGPKKVEAIRNYLVPRNVHDIRRFMGLASFFRRFVPDFARRSDALTRLRKKDEPFARDREQVSAFSDIKTALTTEPTLALYNPRASTELHTDASAVPR